MRWQGMSLAALITLAGLAGADNWPQFRGPNENGLADARRLPTAWSATKNLAWKVSIPGDGWSSPIVWNDRLFLTTAVPEGQSAETYRWEVHCLDRHSGKTLWQQTAAQGKPPIPIHQNNTYASETPATDGQRLYAYFGMKGLFCYDLDGKLLWSKALGTFRTVDDMGTASSPTLADGRLFILCDNKEKSFLAAFDAQTGAELWRQARPSKSSLSSPYVWRNRQRTELVACGSGLVQSFELATGKLLWQIHQLQGGFTATPVGNDELLYVGTAGAFEGGPLFAVRAGATGELTLPRGEASAPGIAWSRPRSGPGSASPLLYGDQLYIFHRSLVSCYEARTGKQLFKERLPDAGNFLASPWAADGKVFGLDESGSTFVLAPGPQFRLLSANWLEGKFWATPAVVEGAIYLREAGQLLCVRGKQG